MGDVAGTEYAVLDCGADPTGKKDSGYAFAAAANEIGAAGTGRLALPPGASFLFESAYATGPGGAPYVFELPTGVELDGAFATLKLAAGLTAGIVLVATNAGGVAVRRLVLQGPTGQADAGIDGGQCGIYGSSIVGFEVAEVLAQDFVRQGCYLSNSSWGQVRHLRSKDNGVTASVAGIEDDANNYTDYIGCQAQGSGGPGLHLVGGASLSDVAVRVLGGAFYGNSFGIEAVNAQGASVIGAQLRANTNDGILIDTCDAVGVTGCYADSNGRAGIYVVQSTNGTITANRCRDNNFGGAQNELGDGIHLYDSAGNTVTGNRCWDDQGTKTQQFGVRSDNGSTANLIADNTVTGNAGAGILATATDIVRSNPGYNPLGYLSPQPAALASGVAWTNPYPFDVIVYVTGGSVTAIAVSGADTGTTTGPVLVQAGQSLTLTFSAAPALAFFGL